jgi:hypothetical protein
MYLLFSGSSRTKRDNYLEDLVLTLTFDENADSELIVKSKVMPFLKETMERITQIHGL